MNLPNKLTLMRLFLIIPIIILFFIFIWYAQNIEKISFEKINYSSKSIWFLFSIGIIFIVSMITDYFDGMLARKNNQITTFGKLFDPLADKIITTTTLIFLGIINYTYWILIIVMIIRDLIVDGSRNLAATKQLKVEASIYGKLKTVFQSIAIPLIIFIMPIIGSQVWWHLFLINVPMILATVMSLFSGWMYFKQIIPYLKNDN